MRLEIESLLLVSYVKDLNGFSINPEPDENSDLLDRLESLVETVEAGSAEVTYKYVEELRVTKR